MATLLRSAALGGGVRRSGGSARLRGRGGVRAGAAGNVARGAPRRGRERSTLPPEESAEGGGRGARPDASGESEGAGTHAAAAAAAAAPEQIPLRREAASPHSRKDTILFYCPQTASLAQLIASLPGYDVTLGDIRWEAFSDGFPNLFIRDAYSIRDRHVAFLAAFDSPQTVFEQLSIMYTLPKLFVASFTLVLPFFPTGTAERVEDEGEVPTAVTLARCLSNVPLSRGGPTSIVTFDIHALQERFYFGDNILPCFESGVPLLKQRLRELEDAENVVIAYPDEGAWKRFHRQFEDSFPEIICTKVRDGDKRIVRLKEGSCEGRHVVIVDDLVQSGGTLLECHKVLANLGAVKVSAYATHGVFPNRSWLRFPSARGRPVKDGFENFWITDSCPRTASEVEGVAPFEILSLAESIAESLQI